MTSPTRQSLFIRSIPLLLLLLWVAALVPSLLLGFGSDADAWSVATNAEQIWNTGDYSASRSTGFPLYELLITPVIMGMGSLGSNIVSLLFGLACIYAFYRIVKKLEARNWFVVVFTFAFLPIFMKSASSTMDYLPALTFLLFAWLAILEERYWPAFFLIGFAVGFRPTHGIFLIPALLLAYQQGRNLSSLLLYAGGTILAALLAYAPVLLEYGFLNPWLGHGFDLKMNLMIWGYNVSLFLGIIPTIGVLGLLAFFGIKNGKQSIQESKVNWSFHVVNITVWLVLFSLLPHEPEYLLPILPSLLLMMNALLPKTIMMIASVLLLSYHFIRVDLLGGESGERKIELSIKPGFTHWDRQDRKFKKFITQAADEYSPEKPTIFMEGASYIPVLNENWTYDPTTRLHRHNSHSFYLTNPILDGAELEKWNREGYRLVVWNQRKWQYVRSGTEEWRNYVDIVDDLEVFFGKKIKGKPLK